MVPFEELWCSSYTYCICLRRKASRVHKNIHTCCPRTGSWALAENSVVFRTWYSKYHLELDYKVGTLCLSLGDCPWILVRVLWKKVCSLSSKNHTQALFQGSKCSPLNFLSPASWKVILNYLQLFQKSVKAKCKIKTTKCRSRTSFLLFPWMVTMGR